MVPGGEVLGMSRSLLRTRLNGDGVEDSGEAVVQSGVGRGINVIFVVGDSSRRSNE